MQLCPDTAGNGGSSWEAGIGGGRQLHGYQRGRLQSMLANKDFTLVNVHIPFEGNIAHTDLSIPYDQIAQKLDKLPDKNTRIALYCRSGRMSSIAAENLVGLGCTHIFSLVGGMAAWEQAGQSIER